MMGRIRDQLRKKYNFYNAKRLKNTDFSIIASNCNGAFISHDLGVRFNSPFVNLWMKPDDYIKFLKDMHYYLNCELNFAEDQNVSYPVGLLDDIYIFFQHYATKEDAREKWIQRSKRLNFDNLFILFTDRDGCTYQNLCDFDALPFKNKVAFTHVSYPELKSTYYLKGWEQEECVGMLFNYKNRLSIKKHYDDFDYITWLNQGK